MNAVRNASTSGVGELGCCTILGEFIVVKLTSRVCSATICDIEENLAKYEDAIGLLNQPMVRLYTQPSRHKSASQLPRNRLTNTSVF